MIVLLLPVWDIHIIISRNMKTLSCDKVSMVTHIYPSKLPKKINVVIWLHPTFSVPLFVVSNIVICKLKEYDIMCDNKCPYWDQPLINNFKLKLKLRTRKKLKMNNLLCNIFSFRMCLSISWRAKHSSNRMTVWGIPGVIPYRHSCIPLPQMLHEALFCLHGGFL